MRLGIVAGLLALLLPAPSVADEFDHTVQFTHKGQVGLSGQTGIGFRFIAPYDSETEYCGEVKDDNPAENKPVCSARSPLNLDLGLSYGVSRSIELFLEMRLGLESDIGANPADDEGPRQLAFSPGVKIYIRDAGLTKFFSSAQLAIDVTDYEQAPDTDFGIRNVNGLQFDFHRTVGVYFFFGETFSFVRWFRFEFDAGLGMQFRVP